MGEARCWLLLLSRAVSEVRKKERRNGKEERGATATVVALGGGALWWREKKREGLVPAVESNKERRGRGRRGRGRRDARSEPSNFPLVLVCPVVVMPVGRASRRAANTQQQQPYICHSQRLRNPQTTPMPLGAVIAPHPFFVSLPQPTQPLSHRCFRLHEKECAQSVGPWIAVIISR
jgi:hypothetical protein